MMRLLILPVFILLCSFTDPEIFLKKIDKSVIDKCDKKGTAEYIVIMKDRVVFNAKLPFKSKKEKATYVYNSLVAKAEHTQSPVLAILKNNRIAYQSFYVTNSIKVTSGKKILLQLAERNDIERIIDNAPFHLIDYGVERSASFNKAADPEWGIKMIKADSVWAMGYRGQGAVIAGQDTGYDWNVSPLKTKYLGYTDSLNIDHNYHWHDAIRQNNPHYADTLMNPCGFNLKQPCDDDNHGTHTMGTMVGEDDNNNIGVAPGARWIACRNMDRGWGQLSTYMECFEWFLAPYDLNGMNPDPGKSPDVINNSWACPQEEGCNNSNWGVMEEVVKNLKASGVVVVVSAGNSGSAGCGSVSGPPALFEASFSVGATNKEDNIAGFSSKGPAEINNRFQLKPNVSAPGVGVRSVIRDGKFVSFSGTSMAGPHVAGLVGLIISANPALAGQVDIIEDIIEASAVPKTSTLDCGNFAGGEVPNAVYGYGRVDALKAIKRALEFTSNTHEADVSKNVNIFPNPAEELITFQLNEGLNTIDEIRIMNTEGQIIKKETYPGSTVLVTSDISLFPSGIYFYHISSKSSLFQGRFVKL